MPDLPDLLNLPKSTAPQDDVSRGQCTHEGCGCAASRIDSFCSTHCESAPDESVCGCGHTECINSGPASEGWIVVS